MSLILMILSLLAAGGAVARFGRQHRERRGLAGAVRTSIADAAEGTRVHLVGTIAPGEELRAPVSDRACVYFAVVIEEHTVAGWTPVYSDARTVPFVVDDGTGRALIDATGAELEIETGRRTGTVARAVLARLDPRWPVMAQKVKLRYREVAFEIGTELAIIGNAVREPDPDAVASVTGYREGLPTRLRLGRSKTHGLWLSDAKDTKQSRALIKRPPQ